MWRGSRDRMARDGEREYGAESHLTGASKRAEKPVQMANN